MKLTGNFSLCIRGSQRSIKADAPRRSPHPAAGAPAPYGECSSKRRHRPWENPGKGGPEAASAHVPRSTWALSSVLKVLLGARPAVCSCSGSAPAGTWCKVEAQRGQPRVRGRTGRGLRALGGRKEGGGVELVPEKRSESQAGLQTRRPEGRRSLQPFFACRRCFVRV